MAGRNTKPGSGGFDSPDKVNSNTLKRHPKMDLSRTDLLQLLSYLEGELQARDIAIATLKAEKAKQLLYQAKYGRFGLGDPFSAMQRDSDNLKDNTFDESAIKSMYDNQLAQLENLIATQRKAQMKMREQMITGEKRYQKACTELDDEKRKHAQDTAQGDDVTYMLEKERERLKQEVDFEKANTKKMEKDLKKTLASLEEERASSAKHKQVALMLITERKKLVERFMAEKKKADQLEKLLSEERTKSMNMAEGLVQESKKSLKMEATMERQLSEFDLEREQMRNKLLREENRTKDLQGQLESLRNHLDSLHKQGKLPKEAVHSVEIKSTVGAAPARMSSERQLWPNTNIASNSLTGKSAQLKSYGESGVIEHEAGLSPRNSPSSDLGVRKRDNSRYTSPQPVERGIAQYGDSLEKRVAPIGAVSDKYSNDSQAGHKLNVTMSGPSVVSGGGRITVQTGSPTPVSGPASPRRGLSVGRGVPPPIPPNKPVLPVATSSKQTAIQQKVGSVVTKDGRVSQPGSKSVHIPVSVVHTSSVSTAVGSRTPKREGSPSTLRKPAQFSDCPASSEFATDSSPTPPTPDSFDFLGPEMADLQQLLVSMVTGPEDSSRVENSSSASSMSSSVSPSSLPPQFTSSPQFTSPLQSTSMPQFKSPPQFTSSPQFTLSPQFKSPPQFTLPPQFTSPPQFTLTPQFTAPQFTSTIAVASPKPSSGSPSVSSKASASFSTDPTGVSSSTEPATPIRGTSSLSTSSVAQSLSSASQLGLGIGSSSVAMPVNKSAPDFSAQFRNVSVTNSSPQQSNFVPYSRIQSPKTSPGRDMPTSPIHRYAASGNAESLRKLIIDLEADVNLPMKDGTTPTHCAAENGQTECLQLLIEKGCNVNCLRDDQMSPVHCSAAEGHADCLCLLLSCGGNVHLSDHSGWTPLHWAASRGHLDCCKLLLDQGARLTAVSNTNATPCHVAIQSGSANCLSMLLTYQPDQVDQSGSGQTDQSTGQTLADDIGVSSIPDKDGWTIAHLASSREDTECLTVILNSCDIDLNCREKLGRTVLDVSSTQCHQLLLPYLNRERLKSVVVEVWCTGIAFMHQHPYVIGTIPILPGTDWRSVDRAVGDQLQGYFSQLDTGLRTKKTSRLDPDMAAEIPQFSLGLTQDSIHSYMVGSYRWLRNGVFPEVSPQDMMSNNNAATISVFLKGTKDDFHSLAYDLLFPISSIHNYVRLLEQYRSVVFYGPEGTRKKQLVKRLASHLVEKERELYEPHVLQIYLHSNYTHRDFVQLLKTEGCLLPSGVRTNVSCILLLFHLEKVQLAGMLGPLLEHIEYRGIQHTFSVKGQDGEAEVYYFPENFYLIATMDKPRSTGLDLSVQQRFRWVHFRINEEPVRNLLARHFLRRLLHTFGGETLSPDNPVFKAVEWLVCVWQRLNDGVAKLGLPDVVFGPDLFLSCPLESQDPQAVFEWMKRLWNESISPVVKLAVSRGTSKDSSGERQNKVANTALYVLMQRAIVPGFPLPGEEKESYLSDFCGSNELDVPMKVDRSPNGGGTTPQRRPLHRGDSPSNLTQMKALTKHRLSVGAEGTSTSLFVNGNGNSSVKRRSLSDTTLARTEQIEIPILHDPSDRSSITIQAKVPKLEIRSPVLGLPIPLHNAFSSPGKSNLSDVSNAERSTHRRSTFSSSHSRIPQSTSKRSRSSENLNAQSGNGYGSSRQFRPTSPFSFSPTTPTSSLFSFKFMDDNSSKNTGVNSYVKRTFSGKR